MDKVDYNYKNFDQTSQYYLINEFKKLKISISKTLFNIFDSLELYGQASKYAEYLLNNTKYLSEDEAEIIKNRAEEITKISRDEETQNQLKELYNDIIEDFNENTEKFIDRDIDISVLPHEQSVETSDSNCCVKLVGNCCIM